MKLAGTLAVAALSALALSSCTLTAPDKTASDTPAARISAGLGTRATGTTWTSGDQIGVMVVSSPESGMTSDYRNVGYLTTSSSTVATFDPIDTDSQILFTESGTVTFAAYYPYVESSSAATLPGSNGQISGSTASQSSDQEAVDFLFATGATASSDSPDVNFSGSSIFTHVMSQLTFKIVAGSGISASAVQSGAFTLSGLCHDGSFDITTGEASASGASTDNWSLNSNCPSSTTDNGVTFTAILYPQSLSTLTLSASLFDGDLTLSTGNLATTLTSLAKGNSYTYTITVNEYGLTVSGSEINDWNTGGDYGAYPTVDGIDLSRLDPDSEDYDYDDDDDILYITENCTISQSNVNKGYTGYIVINSDVTAVKLNGIFVDCTEDTDKGLTGVINISGDITITLSGSNTVSLNDSGTNNSDCIFVSGGATLTIEGDGSLDISQDNGNNQKGGICLAESANIIIQSGTITAHGDFAAPAIGTTNGKTGGNITINGGTINATCGGTACAIGSGQSGTIGNITIIGGTVTAACTSGQGGGIGAGKGGTCGNIIILGGTVSATGLGVNSAAIGTASNDATTAATCGWILIGRGVAGVTASNSNTPTNNIGPGNSASSCSGVVLGASGATDYDETSWTPTAGQFTVSENLVYGWTYDGTDTWTKNE